MALLVSTKMNSYGNNLFRIWYKVQELGIRAVHVDEKAILESSVIVIAAEDSLRLVVNRHVMKELVTSSEDEEFLLYRKLISK